jgi:hypothetical protein
MGSGGTACHVSVFPEFIRSRKKQFTAFEVIQDIHPENHGKWFQVPKDKGAAFVGGTWLLDGRLGDINVIFDEPSHPAFFYHNVVFRDCIIRYTGGRLKLVNVFFERCRFEISPNLNGKLFAQAVLGGVVTELDIP